ncbi:MAG: rhomboid family intramembrane serine protease [Acidobacteria bacterium]|nr:rhomboid family intramembrane serine protease [Acidobacteriota bacterium]
MIPLKDDAPRSTTPWINYFLIAANVAIFIFQLSIPSSRFDLRPHPRLCLEVVQGAPASPLDNFECTFGFVPGFAVAALQGQFSLSRAFVPILTSMFLHAGWLHILGNMWFLYIFGDNVEDHLGHFPYLVMYLLGGMGASLVQTFFIVFSGAGSFIPTVGASGAIAGVMGAYFVLYPRARVLTLVPFLFVWLVWLPAWVMLGYWFVIEFLSGAATAIAPTQSVGGIAFWAHVGGFVLGIILIKIFPARPRRYRYYSWS